MNRFLLIQRPRGGTLYFFKLSRIGYLIHMTEDSIIYIGSKPAMTYVMAVLTAFNQKGADGVILKARGQAISSAVDVAEISRNRFLTGVSKPEIEIGTEELEGQDGGKRNVSTIAILIRKEAEAEAKKPAKKKKEEEE
jgi:archaea-specific DNA-binding protein